MPDYTVVLNAKEELALLYATELLNEGRSVPLTATAVLQLRVVNDLARMIAWQETCEN